MSDITFFYSLLLTRETILPFPAFQLVLMNLKMIVFLQPTTDAAAFHCCIAKEND